MVRIVPRGYTGNAPVICIPSSPRAGDSGDTIGLKCQDLTYDESTGRTGDVPGF